MDRLREAESILELELWLQSPSGKRMLVSGNYQLIKFDNEDCVLTGFVDLTRRIEAEQELLAERRLLKRLLELHERDRQLISYEIHDGIVQDMTAAQMFFESSRPDGLPADDPSHEPFQQGVRLLRGSIDEARRLINGLRPPVLEDEGVIAAVETLVSEMERDAALHIELVTDVKFKRLAPALEMAIYRIVQEGLNNIWHHSRSAKARVELVQRDETIEIRVQDWGIGFDPAKVAKRRYGLMGMRERARLLNGRAIIKSSLGEGTTLHIELPLIDALMPDAE
jgi:signal transduction histidine kinase